jgi:hypothetical protein
MRFVMKADASKRNAAVYGDAWLQKTLKKISEHKK